MPALEQRRARRSRRAFFLFPLLILILILVFALFVRPVRSFAASEQNLALDIRLTLSRTADAAEKEKLWLRLIAECPDTEDAEEAHWALSALYLDEFDEPREDEAQKILEQFLARYPSSPWAPHAESRLLWLRGEEKSLF